MKNEEALKGSILCTGPHDKDVHPGCYTHLYGEPGAKYFLVAFNKGPVREAFAWANNSNSNTGDWIMTNACIDPFKTAAGSEPHFVMNPNGVITVWNTSDRTYTPDPTIHFTLYPLN